MATLRYVKTPAELQEAAENNLEFFDATMQAVKVFYKTTTSYLHPYSYSGNTCNIFLYKYVY